MPEEEPRILQFPIRGTRPEGFGIVCDCCWFGTPIEVIPVNLVVLLSIDRHGELVGRSSEDLREWSLCADCWPLAQAGDLEALIDMAVPRRTAAIRAGTGQEWDPPMARLFLGNQIAASLSHGRSAQLAHTPDGHLLIHLAIDPKDSDDA
jgi:hypothetical protein